jgi:hypothetical protein
MNYKQMLDKLTELEARIKVLEHSQKATQDFFNNPGHQPKPNPFFVPVPEYTWPTITPNISPGYTITCKKDTQ